MAIGRNSRSRIRDLEYPRSIANRYFGVFTALRIPKGLVRGLGLSIAGRIATLHKATIEFRERNGPGIVAVVSFPTERSNEADIDLAVDEDQAKFAASI